MPSNVYKGSKKEKIIKLLNCGHSDNYIMTYYNFDYGYIKHVRQRNAKEIQPAFFTQDTGKTAAKLTGKTDAYYKNELDYGIQELTYNFNDCKKEYNLKGKEPTTFGKRKDTKITRVQRMVDTYQSNEATVGNFK